MPDYIRLKDKDGQYLQKRQDGRYHAVDNPGAAATFEVVPWRAWEPQPEPPALVPITLGNWSCNFLYGPPGSYFKPACINFDDARFERVLTWQKQRGYTHLVINALEMDHWGAVRGHPEWTVRHHRWYDSPQAKNITIARLRRVREVGLQPIVGLFEHTSLPMDINTAIDRANKAVALTWEDVSLYIMCWETDERIPNSQERLDFETTLLSEVDWRGRDVGIHYSQVKRLEGSGFDVSRAWNNAYPGHVVKLYQSRRNAPIDELRHEATLLTDVAAGTGIKLAAFEHSGGDSGIGTVYSEAEANARARACYEIMRAKLPADRTGSMNGKAF